MPSISSVMSHYKYSLSDLIFRLKNLGLVFTALNKWRCMQTFYHNEFQFDLPGRSDITYAFD